MNGVGRGSEDKQDKKKKAKVATHETLGMSFLLFGGLLLLITATGPVLFGDVGKAIAAFFVGFGGFYIFFLLVLLVYWAVCLIAGRGFLPKGWTLRIILLMTGIFFIVQTATAERFFIDPATAEIRSFGAYLADCFYSAGNSVAEGTGGGVLLGLICYPIRFVFQSAGAYVIFAILLLAAVWFALIGTPLRVYLLPGAKKKKEQEEGERETAASPVAFDDIPPTPRTYSPPPAPVAPPAAAAPTEAAPTAPAGSYGQAPAPAEPYGQTAARSPYGAPRSEAQARSRAILFSEDPAESYRQNLIFDEDSRFNSRPRRSNIVPQDGQTYSDRYAEESAEERPSMPRRVTDAPAAGEQSGYSYPISDDNYPQKPSYRAPIEDASGQDFYRNDVAGSVTPPSPAPSAPADDFSPKPIFDEPRTFKPVDLPPEPTFPTASRAESARDMGIFSADPFTGRRDMPPAEPEPPADDIFPRGRRDLPPVEPEPPADDIFPRGRRDLPPVEPEPPADDIFPRGRRDLPPVEPEPPADDIFPRGRRDLPPVEPETPADDIFPRGRRDLPPVEPETPADDGLPESRVFDAGRGSNADLFDDDAPIDAPEPPASAPVPPAPAEPRRKEVPKKKKHVWAKYKRPSVDLLNTYEDRPTLSNEEVGRNSGIILDTLRRYKIETHIISVKAGASVTRYDLAMPENGTISNVTRYDEELAVYLQVKGVNMYANPEVRGISVEVPNEKRSTVGLKAILESEEFRKDSPDALLFALGQDVEGRPVCGNVTEMTHILVAGMTGSGKSIAMHSMLISMLFKYSPEELRLILIDPKQSEFTLYEGIPHLMINEIITSAPKAVTALTWAVNEMERRYTLFNEKTRSGVAVSKIDEYNQNLSGDEERLPKIVVVVDEFSDLMMTAKKEVEERIQRLAQKARAAGIHLVLATQRPDATVITGVIKSNLPTRISLSVDSDLNSRIMLDESGAEKLLGYGDMLIKTTGKPRRAQGAFISASERQRVINYIRENNETYFDESVAEFIDKPEAGKGGGGDDGDGGEVSETYIRALGVVVKRGQASISLIQRSLGIGYNHAGKIIEWMESQGFISAFEGSKARTVLLTKEEFESRFGGLD